VLATIRSDCEEIAHEERLCGECHPGRRVKRPAAGAAQVYVRTTVAAAAARTSPRDRRPGLPCLPDVLAGAPGDTLEGAFKGSESTCQYAA
jgi:hypothetical protein